MMNRTIVFCALVFSTVSMANELDMEQFEGELESAFACDDARDNLIYQDAILLEREGDLASASELFCNLAAAGDDRAQFKYANFLQKNAKNRSAVVIASALANLSNQVYKSARKSQLIEALEQTLSDHEKDLRNSLFSKMVGVFSTGNRLDGNQYLSKKDLDKLRDKKRLFTGSRIKREDAKSLPLRGHGN